MDQKGIVRPAKEVKSIDCKCRYSCKNVSAAQQKILLDEYWSKSDTARQKEYIGNLINEMPIARKRKRNEDSGIEKKVAEYIACQMDKGTMFEYASHFFAPHFQFLKQSSMTHYLTEVQMDPTMEGIKEKGNLPIMQHRQTK